MTMAPWPVFVVVCFVVLIILDGVYKIELCVHNHLLTECRFLRVKNATLELAEHLEATIKADLAPALAAGFNVTSRVASEMANRASQIASDAIAAVQRG
jgi:hypothetical protein